MDSFLYKIYSWYRQNKRHLPWRETSDPYKIWISEIILQQTRVDQGWTYYQNFIKKFPDIESLASADEDQVLKQWQGLGYYSRARNLHKSALTIKDRHRGKFPETYPEILALKGIGPYTAAAIASIAFNLPHPVLDGNVYRFLSRYFGIATPVDSTAGRKAFEKLAIEIMPDASPGFHNEALMEFGALQCVPKSPGCPDCPLSGSCHAFANNTVNQLPVKAKKTSRRFRYLYYYLIDNGTSIWLEKRTGDDIWKNLYQFPVLETPGEMTDEEAVTHQPAFLKGYRYAVKSLSGPRKHVLSHQTLHARLIHIEMNNCNEPAGQYINIQKTDIHKYPVPRLIEKFAQKSGIFEF